ncbi:MAG TPA: hypothetical protein VHC43_18260 [Mycobacteriales bacterium]|nr:hypothetical protein [Mycobacteriales bacterium]
MALGETYRAYAEAMWDAMSSLATWHPDVALSIGDVVRAGPGGVVHRETTLAKLGVATDRLTHSRHDASPVREHRGVTLSAAGSASVAAGGRVRASFSKASSFLVVTAQGWLDTVDSSAEARVVVEELHAGEAWESDWHLVSSVRTYPACTILIAKSAGVGLDVEVDLSAVSGALTPNSIRAGATVSVNSDHASHWVMDFDSTPFYEAIGMRRRGLRRRVSADHSEYLTRAGSATEIEADRRETEEVAWVAQRSSPTDLGLL